KRKLPVRARRSKIAEYRRTLDSILAKAMRETSFQGFFVSERVRLGRLLTLNKEGEVVKEDKEKIPVTTHTFYDKDGKLVKDKRVIAQALQDVDPALSKSMGELLNTLDDWSTEIQAAASSDSGNGQRAMPATPAAPEEAQEEVAVSAVPQILRMVRAVAK
ncbi:MAG: hypothetical protein V1746_07915, partial [bacterium]